MTGRRGRRCKQLLDDLKEMRGYWKLKEEALDRTVWRTGCGIGRGPVVRQTRECISAPRDYVHLHLRCLQCKITLTRWKEGVQHGVTATSEESEGVL